VSKASDFVAQNGFLMLWLADALPKDLEADDSLNVCFERSELAMDSLHKEVALAARLLEGEK
jgi:hypothetical protein